MELYVEKDDYDLSVWKKENDIWYTLTGWSTGIHTWVPHKTGPQLETTLLSEIKNDTKNEF